jgi:acetolactate synthase-1/2/3 large subunit
MGRRGADVIIDYLVQQWVPYLVGVSTHDQRIAAFIADAYYRVSGHPIATFTSCGPGSVNIIMTIGRAMSDSSAMLAITGDVPNSQFNRGPFQESWKYFQGDLPTVNSGLFGITEFPQAGPPRTRDWRTP